MSDAPPVVHIEHRPDGHWLTARCHEEDWSMGPYPSAEKAEAATITFRNAVWTWFDPIPPMGRALAKLENNQEKSSGSRRT